MSALVILFNPRASTTALPFLVGLPEKIRLTDSPDHENWMCERNILVYPVHLSLFVKFIKLLVHYRSIFRTQADNSVVWRLFPNRQAIESPSSLLLGCPPCLRARSMRLYTLWSDPVISYQLKVLVVASERTSSCGWSSISIRPNSFRLEESFGRLELQTPCELPMV